jgi:hypothetical protein
MKFNKKFPNKSFYSENLKRKRRILLFFIGFINLEE